MDVLMPQLGETVAEGKITQWFKSAGDTIAPGDNLFEIETDKVSMEVPSTSSGVLAEIRVPAGTVAPVGAVVAVIANSSADGAAASSGAAPRAATANTSVTLPSPPSPLLARMAGMASFASEAASARPAKLDPFREVRTPERNYGPARLAGGITITPLARRLAAEARTRSGADQGLRPARAHCRSRCREGRRAHVSNHAGSLSLSAYGGGEGGGRSTRHHSALSRHAAC